MTIFLLIFFGLLGVSGLIFKVDVGVFTGLGLLPWQVIKLKKGKNLTLLLLILSGGLGSIHFLRAGEWKWLVGFILIILYNYWGYSQTQKKQQADQE